MSDGLSPGARYYVIHTLVTHWVAQLLQSVADSQLCVKLEASILCCSLCTGLNLIARRDVVTIVVGMPSLTKSNLP